MAVVRTGAPPEGAVRMDELEATSYVWEVVEKWQDSSDTWALRYGSSALGFVNAFSGIMINRHYRRKLKLGSYGYMSSVIPISLMPGILTTLFHRHQISTSLLLMKHEGCPICYEVRSAGLQLLFGIAYPMVLGPTAALMYANRYNTFRAPSLLEGPRKMYGFVKKISKNFGGPIAFLTAFQIVASSIVTYFEMRNNFQLRIKLMELENKLLEQQSENVVDISDEK